MKGNYICSCLPPFTWICPYFI